MKDVIFYDDAKWGKTGSEIVPSVLYQVYRVSGTWNGDDESVWYSFEPGDDVEASEIAFEEVEGEKVMANKYKTTAIIGGIAKVAITVSSQLKALYPFAHVIIDGKEFDLEVLSNPVEFVMDKNHKIVIDWSADLKEAFRVVVCR